MDKGKNTEGPFRHILGRGLLTPEDAISQEPFITRLSEFEVGQRVIFQFRWKTRHGGSDGLTDESEVYNVRPESS